MPVRLPLFSCLPGWFPCPVLAALQLKIYGMGTGMSTQIGQILELSLFWLLRALRNLARVLVYRVVDGSFDVVFGEAQR